MSFRDIVTLPLRLIDRLNPLDRGAGYMLRNLPTLWRVSVLKIIWYLLLAHGAMFLAGWSAAEALTHLPTRTEMLSIRVMSTILAIMVGFAWCLSVWQTPLIRRNSRTILLTWLVYAGFIFGLVTTTQAYLSPLSHQVASLYDARHFDHDIMALADPFAQICDEPRATDLSITVTRLHGGHPDHQALSEIVDTLLVVEPPDCAALRATSSADRSLVKIPLTRLLQDVSSPTRFSLGLPALGRDSLFGGNVEAEREYEIFIFRVAENTPQNSFSLRPLSAVTLEAQLDGRLDAAKLAHERAHQRQEMRYVQHLLRPEIALFSGALATFLLIVELSQGRWFLAAAGQLQRRARQRQEKKSFTANFNARLIKKNPIIWQMRLPSTVFLIVFIFLFGWIAIDFSTKIIKWVQNLPVIGSSDDIIVASITFFYCLILIIVTISLMQLQVSYFGLDVRRRNAGLQYFCGLFLPILTACLIGSAFNAMAIGNDVTDGGFVWYIAAVFGYLAATFSWSQTFLGLRRAITYAIAFGVIVATITFIVIISPYGEFLFENIGNIALIIILMIWLAKLKRWVHIMKNPLIVTIIVYGLSSSTLSIIFIVQRYQEFIVTTEYMALIVNGYFLVLPFFLSPLLNRLQEITVAPIR